MVRFTNYDECVEELTAPIKTDIMSRAIVFLDIDGLFANLDQRLDDYQKKDWDKFYGVKMASDTIHDDYISVAAMLAGILAIYDEVEIVFVTGRPERTRDITALWLKSNFPLFKDFPFHDWEDEVDGQSRLLMRKDEDHRVGFRVKYELIKAFNQKNNPNADWDIFYLDDDYRNIRYVGMKMAELEPPYFFKGMTIGHYRLPSVHAVNSTEELGQVL